MALSKPAKTKALTSNSKDIVNNVYEYFVKEVREPSKTPTYAFVERTAEATGLNKRTINRIRRGLKNTDKSESPKSREELKPLDDFDKCAIRNKIYQFYTVRHVLLTLKNLRAALKEDIHFAGSTWLLRKELRELGFKWKRSKSQRKVLVEKQNVVDNRMRYYAKKKQLQEAGYNFVYIDETWVDTSYTAKYCWQGPDMDGVIIPVSKGERLIVFHGGSKHGFVQGALLVYKASSSTGDNHSEMNGERFKKWLIEMLLVNLGEKSCIVMDNAPYHSVHASKFPNFNSRKADITNWLTEHNIPFREGLLRRELYLLAKQHKPVEPKYLIDNVIRSHGHEVLRLPPYHPDLNPIEIDLESS